jgi:hypothetical protein
MIIGFNTQIMPEMAARTLCRSARLRTQFCGVLQKAQGYDLCTILSGVIMTGKRKRAGLVLSVEQRAMLTELAGLRTSAIREVKRSRILLGDADGASISELMRRVRVGRPMIYKCIDKALGAGVGAGLRDACHCSRAPKLTRRNTE